MKINEVDQTEEKYYGNWTFRKDLIKNLKEFVKTIPLTESVNSLLTNIKFKTFINLAYPQIELSLNDNLLERRTAQSRTYKEIISAIDPSFLQHAKRASILQGIRLAKGSSCTLDKEEEPSTFCNGTMAFVVPSSNNQNNGINYINRIQITEWNDVVNDLTLTPQEATKLIIWSGHVKVHCTCPSFLYYGFQYILTQLGISIYPEDRPPHIRNPGLKGIVCKHLNRSIKAFPFYGNEIRNQVKKERSENAKENQDIHSGEDSTRPAISTPNQAQQTIAPV